MKIVHFSTFDIQGGAANAAYQLHQSFKLKGLNSIMLVSYKKSNDSSVFMIGNSILKSKLIQNLKRNEMTYYIFNKVNKLTLKFGKNIFIKFNKDKTEPFHKIKKYLQLGDIVCLHWIDNFLSIETIKQIQDFTKTPIVWILQDIEPLTGGCHYTDGCEKYKFSCGNCPQLKSDSENDLSHQIWEKKKKYLGQLNIIFITPTSWVQEKIRESSLFKNFPAEKILLPLDDDIFNQKDREKSRINLNIPENAKVIFFGAQSFNEKRKGMHLLKKSLDILYLKIKNNCPKNLDRLLLLSAGRDTIKISQHFKQIQLGWINNQNDLAKAYKVADAFACPSIEDAGPIMINQSIACGTPVVSFEMGVAKDLIINPDCGYITENFNSEKFAENLYKALFEKDYKKNIPTYNSDKITEQYIELFKKLSKNDNKKK